MFLADVKGFFLQGCKVFLVGAGATKCRHVRVRANHQWFKFASSLLWRLFHHKFVGMIVSWSFTFVEHFL